MQQSERLISVNENGALQFIYDDDLAFLTELGDATTKRASQVEPTDNNEWTATMNDGTVLGPFKLRQEALAAEIEFLKERIL